MENCNYFESRKSYRLVVIVFSLLLVTLSCEQIGNDEVPNDPLVLDHVAIERFEKFVSNPENAVDAKLKDYISGKTVALVSVEESELIEHISQNELRPLLNESLIFLNSSGFTDQELISEFGSLDDPGLVITAFVLLIGLSDGEISDIRDARSNNFMHCLGSATGLYGIYALATGAAAVSRVAILKAVGKFARRSLGWIGAALFVGEFIQCYWGGNSIFDRT